jgi:hypothetical protein
MVLLILTGSGMDDALEAALVAKAPVWLNAGLLGSAEVTQLRARGLDLTTMAFRTDPLDREEVEDVVNTVREHHPGQMLFVEWPDPAG